MNVFFHFFIFLPLLSSLRQKMRSELSFAQWNCCFQMLDNTIQDSKARQSFPFFLLVLFFHLHLFPFLSYSLFVIIVTSCSMSNRFGWANKTPSSSPIKVNEMNMMMSGDDDECKRLDSFWVKKKSPHTKHNNTSASEKTSSCFSFLYVCECVKQINTQQRQQAKKYNKTKKNCK